jgi:hypothetical protein
MVPGTISGIGSLAGLGTLTAAIQTGIHAGYVSLGVGGGSAATINKFRFSDDSRTTLAEGLSSSRIELAGFANSGTAGYFAGGYIDGTSLVASVQKFAFSNDSRTTLATGLSATGWFGAAMANSGIL